ncbi:hypothetical protein KSP40_PGU020643 [Platanthera guangdongensis]|uniref:Uncharacterized protein n=1 Tax=Platanthera guangdongensis TaxID=2320717 RepID=A0ABR2M1T6_9ASPA
MQAGSGAPTKRVGMGQILSSFTRAPCAAALLESQGRGRAIEVAAWPGPGHVAWELGGHTARAVAEAVQPGGRADATVARVVRPRQLRGLSLAAVRFLLHIRSCENS